MSVVGMADMGERGSASLSRCHIADALRVRQITQKSRCSAWNCDVCRLYFALSSARPALALASAAALHFASVMVAFAKANQMRCSVPVGVNAPRSSLRTPKALACSLSSAIANRCLTGCRASRAQRATRRRALPRCRQMRLCLESHRAPQLKGHLPWRLCIVNRSASSPAPCTSPLRASVATWSMKDRPARMCNQHLRAACRPPPWHRPALTAAPERVAPLQARTRVLLHSDHTMTGVAR